MKAKENKPLNISAEDTFKRRKKEFPPMVIDLRSSEEYKIGHLPAARQLEASEWDLIFDELPPLTVVIFYDADGGKRSIGAAEWTRAKGYRNGFYVEGGYAALAEEQQKDQDNLSNYPLEAWPALIEELFDKYVRPILAADGGGAEIVSVSESELKIRYLGACTTCSGGTDGTLKLIDGFIQNHYNHSFDIQIQASGCHSAAPALAYPGQD